MRYFQISNIVLFDRNHSYISRNLIAAVSSTDLSATDATDYDKVESVVTFGADIHSNTVSITVTLDDYIEHDEHFLLTLHDPVNGTVGDMYKAMVIVKDKNTPGK